MATDVRQELAQYKALMILTNQFTRDHRQQIDRVMANPEGEPNIDQFLRICRSNVALLEREFGVTRASVAALLGNTPNEPTPNSRLWITVAALRRISPSFSKAIPLIDDLPGHARIGLDVYGQRGDDLVEWVTLESMLFEDMAMLWNAAQRAADDVLVSGSVLNQKRLAACQRALIRSAFHLLEGYLNGLATDILTEMSSAIGTKDRAILLEQDGNRFRPVSLRDKILQYPKIALGAKHPPIQESPDSDLAAVLKAERDLRNTLIHPNPRAIQKGSEWLNREGPFYADLEQSSRVVINSVVSVIQQIDGVLGGRFGRVSLWLVSLPPTQRFPDEVFT